MQDRVSGGLRVFVCASVVDAKESISMKEW